MQSVQKLGPRQGAFRSDINALRAIAVVGVLLFHFSVPPFSGGYAGVDVFFVISGFLMTEIIQRRADAGEFRLLHFWKDRAKRIVPALAAMVLATLLFGYWFIDPANFGAMAASAVHALLFTSNVDFWLAGGYFDGPQKAKWFLHTWSLSVEWQFYILYPIAMWALFRLFRTRSAMLAAYTTALALSLAACLWAAHLGIEIHSRIGTANFYLLPTRAWEMMVGGLVALRPSWLKSLQRRWLHWAGLALISISFVIFDETTRWPSVFTLVPTIGTAAVLIVARQEAWTQIRPVENLGLWSYSIYLWHWPLSVALFYFDVELTLWIAAIAIAASVAAGAASYRWIESPTRRWLDGGSWAIWVTAGVGAATLVTVAAAIVSSHGLPDRRGRDPQIYAALNRAAADWEFSCPARRFYSSSYPACIRGQGQRRVALLGDSHMQQWFGRYGNLPRPSPEIHFLTTSGCPPIPGTSRPETGRACWRGVNWAWQSLLNQHFDVVVVEASWDFYASVPSARLCFIRNKDCEVLEGADYEVALQQHLTEMARRLDALVSSGTEVVLVLDMPGAGDGAPQGLSKLYWSGGEFETVAYTPRRSANALVLSALAGTRITVVNPADYVCEAERCRVLGSDGQPLYRDSGHLRSSATRSPNYAFLDRYVLGTAPILTATSR